jgi:hypothetical protein
MEQQLLHYTDLHCALLAKGEMLDPGLPAFAYAKCEGAYACDTATPHAIRPIARYISTLPRLLVHLEKINHIVSDVWSLWQPTSFAH